mmetsp:Transcript_2676/g.3043  ORF Transcript_2676/g.3043 Transcript_2676/m.3043 type:complete len:215 (-) Transcript_2676:542-1186(-)
MCSVQTNTMLYFFPFLPPPPLAPPPPFRFFIPSSLRSLFASLFAVCSSVMNFLTAFSMSSTFFSSFFNTLVSVLLSRSFSCCPPSTDMNVCLLPILMLFSPSIFLSNLPTEAVDVCAMLNASLTASLCFIGTRFPCSPVLEPSKFRPDEIVRAVGAGLTPSLPWAFLKFVCFCFSFFATLSCFARFAAENGSSPGSSPGLESMMATFLSSLMPP